MSVLAYPRPPVTEGRNHHNCSGGKDSIFAEVHARQQAILQCRFNVHIGGF
jgi:hypothetical protein